MGHTHKYERADNDVEHRVSRYEHQDAPGVRCQPNVVLANKELGGKIFKVRYVQRVREHVTFFS